MLIRQATAADIPDIVRFRGHLWDSFLSDTKVADHPDWPERAGAVLVDLLTRDTHRYLVTEDEDGRLVGTVSGLLELHMPGPAWPGVSASLSDMWVEPDARGRGVARALMAGILDWVKASGASKVRLHSTPVAVQAYERMGFHVAEAKPGDERFPVMWMDFPRED